MEQDELLDAALRERNLSIRRAGILLAERKGTRPENERRSLARWLGGQKISDDNAEHLAAVLDYPYDYFKADSDGQPRSAWRQEAAALRADLRTLEERLRVLEARRRPPRANGEGRAAG